MMSLIIHAEQTDYGWTNKIGHVQFSTDMFVMSITQRRSHDSKMFMNVPHLRRHTCLSNVKGVPIAAMFKIHHLIPLPYSIRVAWEPHFSRWSSKDVDPRKSPWPWPSWGLATQFRQLPMASNQLPSNFPTLQRWKKNGHFWVMSYIT
jgi:hypothetical protein